MRYIGAFNPAFGIFEYENNGVHENGLFTDKLNPSPLPASLAQALGSTTIISSLSPDAMALPITFWTPSPNSVVSLPKIPSTSAGTADVQAEAYAGNANLPALVSAGDGTEKWTPIDQFVQDTNYDVTFWTPSPNSVVSLPKIPCRR